MATNEGLAVEALYKRLSQTEVENGLAKECEAVWGSWASDVDKIVLALSEVDRGFKFCKSSLLGVRKLPEGWSLLRAVSLALFHSVKTCVMSHNIFLKTWRHQFLNRTERKLIGRWPDYFSPPRAKNRLGMRLAVAPKLGLGGFMLA